MAYESIGSIFTQYDKWYSVGQICGFPLDLFAWLKSNVAEDPLYVGIEIVLTCSNYKGRSNLMLRKSVILFELTWHTELMHSKEVKALVSQMEIHLGRELEEMRKQNEKRKFSPNPHTVAGMDEYSLDPLYDPMFTTPIMVIPQHKMGNKHVILYVFMNIFFSNEDYWSLDLVLCANTNRAVGGIMLRDKIQVSVANSRTEILDSRQLRNISERLRKHFCCDRRMQGSDDPFLSS